MEKDWKLLSPLGVADIMESDCSLKNKIAAEIAGALDRFGYNEIQTPTFEYFNVFADDLSISQEDVIKFIDNSGKILALRPDYTTAIARAAASHKSDADLPLRLRYQGSIFRSSESYTGARQKEFTQAGAELIGPSCPEADAEIIIMTIDALLRAGLNEFQLEIGHPGFLRGVAEGLSEDEFVELTELLDKKFILGIEEFCKKLKLEGKTAEILCEMPNLYGDAGVARDMLGRGLNPVSEAAVKNLLAVYDLVKDYGYEQYISVDLGLVRSFNYYTGIVFKGITHGVAFPICGGGRYDTLGSRFGTNFPATGTAIWTDRVMTAIVRQGLTPQPPKADVLVWYSREEDRPTAYALAREQRREGLRVICERHSFENGDEVCKYLSDHKILSAAKAEIEAEGGISE